MRIKSDCIRRSGDTQSYGETWEQDEKKFKIRRSVEFSSATARCMPWRVDGHSNGETCRNKRGVKECGPFRIWKLGVFMNKKKWRRDRLLLKQLTGNRMHPVNQTAREVQKLWKKGMVTQSIHVSSHSSSYESSLLDRHEHLRTRTWRPWMIWTWIWLFGAKFWIPLFKQQFILDKTVRRIYDSWRITFGKVWDSYSMKLENWSVNKKKSPV